MRGKPFILYLSTYVCTLLPIRHQGLVRHQRAGRPFDLSRDINGYPLPGNRYMSPPNLKGRSLNVDEEVERPRLILMEQANNTSYCDNRHTPQRIDRRARSKAAMNLAKSQGRMSDLSVMLPLKILIGLITLPCNFIEHSHFSSSRNYWCQ